uniref:Uncharacterized protein n=1 Tax=Tetranychus urticae TaxID=32264 RepID=T1KFJ3_TETUR
MKETLQFSPPGIAASTCRQIIFNQQFDSSNKDIQKDFWVSLFFKLPANWIH